VFKGEKIKQETSDALKNRTYCLNILRSYVKPVKLLAIVSEYYSTSQYNDFNLCP